MFSASLLAVVTSLIVTKSMSAGSCFATCNSKSGSTLPGIIKAGAFLGSVLPIALHVSLTCLNFLRGDVGDRTD